MFSLLSNVKNIGMAVMAALVGGYVLKQKYDAYQAETKLKNVENKIAKSNVIIAKSVAKAKADGKEIEHDMEVEVLRALKVERKKVLSEMDVIEKVIADTKKEQHNGRTRSKKVTIDA